MSKSIHHPSKVKAASSSARALVEVRRKATLLKASALQNAILISPHVSSIATDELGVIQVFNSGAERMLGYAAPDVVDRMTPADLSDPGELVERANALSLELGTRIQPGFDALVFKASRGMEDSYELTFIRKDGSRFPAMVSVTALRDVRAKVIGYLLIGTDNTARKELDEQQKVLDQRLRDQQFYTRSLIESNVDALMTTNPAGIITDVNKEMEALTGCTRDELIGAPFKNYFTDPARAEAAIKLVLSLKKVTNYELTARATSGRETVVSYNATTFHDRDRKLQGVFAAARDITERKRLDRILQEKNEELESARSAAEQASLAKTDFLSSMSHELRSPLNAILGFAQLLESDSPPPTISQREGISQILKAGWHLLTLINEILDLARIESGQVPMSREPVSLAEVFQESHGMVKEQAKRRNITLAFTDFATPVFVKGDRTRIKQVVINLLSNAIKYNRESGSVRVECMPGTGENIRVAITDTGAGLSPAQVGQLFQAFNRLGQEAGREEGTGIGLVVAKRLVELMGGALGVDSSVGKGSTFWFELGGVAEPSTMLGQDAQASAGPARTAGDRINTVLYVEDNPANLKLVERLLARHPDVRLLTAVSGALGVAAARSALPDVILMDINMPGMDGFQALRLLQAEPSTARIPAIAISANAMASDVERGMQAGFLQYITKPINVAHLMAALDDAFLLAATTRPAPSPEAHHAGGGGAAPATIRQKRGKPAVRGLRP